ncbi:hypothetical protein P9D51_12325 [Bacillus sonorensis]|uniref:hypothetical protein n=2 Tax=Bacillus sonorensis TaxID=119858 RepID=UPI002DBFCD6D|nr:hypothetical protein [Bacillus sonorensis]MEC1426881.1 hypothetical protein [Bacillus sonorensis]
MMIQEINWLSPSMRTDKNVVEIRSFKESFNFLLTIERDKYLGIQEVYDSDLTAFAWSSKELKL